MIAVITLDSIPIVKIVSAVRSDRGIAARIRTNSRSNRSRVNPNSDPARMTAIVIGIGSVAAWRASCHPHSPPSVTAIIPSAKKQASRFRSTGASNDRREEQDDKDRGGLERVHVIARL